MRLARVLGAIGRALISAGVIVLLFVGYQLWGTGIQHSQAQGSLEDDFLELLESSAADEAQRIAVALADDDGGLDEPGEAAASDPGAVLIEPDLADVEYSQEFLSKLYPDEGEAFARIVIPDINVDEIVVEGVSTEDLRKGPGHYLTTPNPGQAGNSAIAGHRTTYGAPFHRIDELQPGARILVTTLQGTFEYRVKENVAPDGTIKGHFIVSPSDVWVLGQESEENVLTLTACHPKYSARQRIIVQAELVGEPAPTIPRDEAQSLEPLDLSSGASDEEAADPSEQAAASEETVIGDAVAADDDPSVDASGEPIEGASGYRAGDASDDATDDATDDASAASGETASASTADDASGALATDEVELTAGETPFGEPEDFGEGLNGDSTKVKPAVMWGLAGGSIWMAASFIGHRLNRRWTLYAIGLVPFGFVLWACFVNVDQALPSY